MNIDLSNDTIHFRVMRVSDKIKASKDKIIEAFQYKYAVFSDPGITYFGEEKMQIFTALPKLTF